MAEKVFGRPFAIHLATTTRRLAMQSLNYQEMTWDLFWENDQKKKTVSSESMLPKYFEQVINRCNKFVKNQSQIVIPKSIIQKAQEDLLAYTQKDPASGGDSLYVFCACSSFKAVALYRIANYFLLLSRRLSCQNLKLLSGAISDYAKTRTGIEIHPGATIGKRFVIDHGIGTVIGETASIGDNCYFLQGVILGARGISNNPSAKRHPSIGNNVEIGGYARIFGPITVGDNVNISPHCVITENIPKNTRVFIKTSNQIIKNLNRCA